MRLFIALNFSPETRRELYNVQTLLRECSTFGNYTAPKNLHLTLAFLGEISPERIPPLRTLMSSISASPFSLQFDKLGYFPGKGQEKLWYLTGQTPPDLARLADKLHRALQTVGFSLEDREFLPHVTLGRRCITENVPEISPVTAKFHSMELMLSERIDGVLTYTPIFSAQLR